MDLGVSCPTGDNLMKRYLATLLASLVFSSTTYAAGRNVGQSESEFVKIWLDKYLYACENNGTAVLAMNSAGYFRLSFFSSLARARTEALRACLNCEIVDENCTSTYIKKLARQKNKTAGTYDSEPISRTLIATGTGFAVNDYYVVSASHVLDTCNSVSIRHKHKEYKGEVAALDPTNDLGLIRLEERFLDAATLRDVIPVMRGEMIASYGYPLYGQLSDSAKVTQGNVNDLAGWMNDSRILQYDAPSQPGNSGGPLIYSSGTVVGMVSSQLSLEYAQKADHIAQNVNFAVKSYLLEGFLSANGVDYQKEEPVETLSLPKIAMKAEKFTVLVGCWQ